MIRADGRLLSSLAALWSSFCSESEENQHFLRRRNVWFVVWEEKWWDDNSGVESVSCHSTDSSTQSVIKVPEFKHWIKMNACKQVLLCGTKTICRGDWDVFCHLNKHLLDGTTQTRLLSCIMGDVGCWTLTLWICLITNTCSAHWRSTCLSSQMSVAPITADLYWISWPSLRRFTVGGAGDTLQSGRDSVFPCWLH